ncbi:hypothetical protein AA637_14895 [Cyanobacterium sp. HL-69]|uniref:polysaccharide pyruvyl transferase family protein n=1 Tax=Cyanobacterium sp. HL-69 TaxID=2054282 RepID=UPI000CA32754|nr:hypothetical protein AA637_14895 [Cyanobacterium sp. HL-69]
MNIIHISPFGEGFNIGNFAIALSVRKWIYKIYGHSANIITLPAMAEHLNCGLTKKTIYLANQIADAVIIGGGNLYENNELKIDLNALESLSVPLVLFSLSIGKIYGRDFNLSRRTDVMPDSLLTILNKKAKFSLARDLATFHHLKNLLPEAKHITLGGCPTLFLDEWTSSFSFKQTTMKSDICLISIRNPNQMNVPLSVANSIPDLINSVNNFVFSKGYKKVKILCHDQRDLIFANSIGIPYVYTSDVYEYLSLIKSASLVVSMRVHATLPCLALGTPVINISYDERSLSLLHTIGYADWDLNLLKSDNILLDISDRLSLLDIHKMMKQKSETKIIWSKLYEIQQKAILMLK